MPVERTVSRWRKGRWDTAGEKLASYQSVHAYVLLGEAGSGKSTSFSMESENDVAGLCISARRFARRSSLDPSQWAGETLFIDGLDETRIGAPDPRKPLDALLGHLEAIGSPRFRLSCREEYWLGDNDHQELRSATNGKELHLLRLDPLTLDDTRQILEAKGIQDPDDFIWTMIDRGLASFLGNPLLLDLLIKSELAESGALHPREIFERACRHLAKETNAGHVAATDGARYSTDQVVRAAGRLCAIILISDKSGWSGHGPRSEDFPQLSDVGGNQLLLKTALDTMLFEGSVDTGRHPRHRHIAEFLAAGYLDHAISAQRLTPARALGLLQGSDGITIPYLRGTSIWLAAMNSVIRHSLIEADPVGVAFLGDASGFSRQDTERLFGKLELQLEHQWEWPSQASLAALVAGPARQLLWNMLESRDRSPGRNRLVADLLWGLAAIPVSDCAGTAEDRSTTASKACEVLSTVVRDATWQAAVRIRAISALVHIADTRVDGPPLLREILRDLDEGRIAEDESGELRGKLRTFFYPRYLSANEIWDYAEGIWEGVEARPLLHGTGKNFWTEHLIDGSSPEDIRILLDTLVPRVHRLNPLLARNGVESLIPRLLARGLELFGEKVPLDKIYDWFQLVENDYEHTELVPAHCTAERLRSRNEQDQRRIRGWLRDHPDIQLGLILEGVKRNATRQIILVLPIGMKFLGKTAPPDFREWCLKTAIRLADESVPASRHLASWATTKEDRDQWGPPLSDASVAAAIESTPALQEWNRQRLDGREWEAEQRERQLESPTLIRSRKRQQDYVASIQEHLPAIMEGGGPLGILHDLGRVYLNGMEAGGADQAHEDLQRWLRPDQALYTAATTGFRRLSHRTDLPTLNDIVKLHKQYRMSLFAAPFLAGLSESELAGVDPLQHLGGVGLSRALGYYLLSGLPTRRHPDPRLPSYTVDCRPQWFRLALQERPEIVARAFVKINRVRVAVKDPPDQHLWDMAKEEEYEGVAKLALPGMFGAFPTRCTEAQVERLRPILRAALRHLAPEKLKQHVLQRIARKGMDSAQRVLWLALGLFVKRDECLPELLDFVADGGEAKLGRLVQFLAPDGRPLQGQDWPTTDLAALAKAVGGALAPPWQNADRISGIFRASGRGFPRMQAERLVNGWIDTLADRTTQEAISTLGDLAEEPSLKPRRARILQAMDGQARKRRMEAYQAPTLKFVRQALEGGPPASAADLAALTVDKTRELAVRIRHDNTDIWQQFWHTDASDGRKTYGIKPKPESECRKVLLSHLGPLLEPYRVMLEPEGFHAEEKRSDIVAIHTPHIVPIEIKMTGSRDLWTAIKNQLIPRYMRDPRCGGYGIFLVFWHGHKHLAKSQPPGIRRPTSAEEMKQQLEAALTSQQRRTISIIVVDVSAPQGWVK